MKNGFLKVLFLEFKILAKSPKRILYVLVFPLLLFGFLGSLLNEGIPRDLPVAYIDHDQSQLSAKLAQMIDASPEIKLQSTTDILSANHLMKNETVYAYIEIPENFQKNIYKGIENKVVCYTNNQFLLPAGLIKKSFQLVTGVFSAGIKINKDTQNKIQLNRAINGVQPVLADVHTLYNPFTNYAYYLLTAFFPMMLQMIVVMTTIYAIGIELKYKSAKKWYLNSGENVIYALFGKLLPYTIALLFVGWWMNYLLFTRIGTPLRAPMLNVNLATFLFIIIYQIIGIFIVSVFRDFRAALTVGSGYTAIAFSFVAYTFPAEGLPKSMQILAKIFPFTHYLEYYVNRAIKGIPLEFTLNSLWLLISFSLLFLLAIPLFAKRLKSSEYA